MQKNLQKLVLTITTLSLILLSQSTFAAQKRLALIIGNSAYSDAPLKNPANDATDMAKQLESVGFEVMKLINADIREMKQGIRDFGKKLKSEDMVGLFYFAGHGIQKDGNNYLVPVKSRIESEADVEFEAVNAGRVLQQMELAENKLNLVILDACRNNPFAKSFRSANRGLGKMEAPTGSMILYATSPGNVAADGSGRNGLFTEKLLSKISQPGLKIEDVFKQTAYEVSVASNKKQYPYIEGYILGDFYFTEPDGGRTQSDSPDSAFQEAAVKEKMEVEFWESVESSPSREMYSAYLDEYPNGHYAVLARLKLKQMSASGNITRKPYNPSQSTVGSIAVKSNIGDEDIYVDGKKLARGQLDMDLAPGPYLIEVKKDGYTTWSNNITVKAGVKHLLSAKLTALATPAVSSTSQIAAMQKTFADKPTASAASTDDPFDISKTVKNLKTYKFSNGDAYQGEMSANKFHGKGIYTFKNGERYEGEFKLNKRHGKGSFFYNSGNRFVGIYDNGKKHGYGTYYFSNGDRYEGDFTENQRTGEGTYFYSNGNRYVGAFLDGKRHGKGIYHFSNGDYFEGTYRNDERDGEGVMHFANGTSQQQIWANGADVTNQSVSRL